VSHQVVLALFDSQSSAAAALRELHALGVGREDLSIVARSHDEEGELAREMDATPGAEIEDSRIAARLGELGGQLLAAIAIVMPGIGPIVAAGPLAADLGEVAGHVAGGIVPMLTRAGVSEPDAKAFEQAVEQGAILVGVHARAIRSDAVRDTLMKHGGRGLALAFWAN
jgi:Heat induced stress protein YflT